MGYFNTVGVWVPDTYLSHEGRSIDDGAKVGSGRYRKGSGKRPNQHVGKTGAFAKNYSSAAQMAKEVGEAYRNEKAAINGNKDALDALNRRTVRKLSSKLDADKISKATGMDRSSVDEQLNKANKPKKITIHEAAKDVSDAMSDLMDDILIRGAQNRQGRKDANYYLRHPEESDGVASKVLNSKGKRVSDLYKETYDLLFAHEKLIDMESVNPHDSGVYDGKTFKMLKNAYGRAKNLENDAKFDVRATDRSNVNYVINLRDEYVNLRKEYAEISRKLSNGGLDWDEVERERDIHSRTIAIEKELDELANRR